MRMFLTAALLSGLISAPAAAQNLNISLNAVAANAKDKTEISLEGPALQLLKMAVSNKVSPQVQDIYAHVDGFSLYHYEFANAGEYSDRDLEPLRKQVNGAAGWSRVLQNKDAGGTTEIYVFTQGGKTNGFLLITGESKELTVVHVAGSLQLAQLQELVKSTLKYQEPAQ